MSLHKQNLILADQFSRLADLTEIDGGSFWSVRSFKKASDIIRELDVPIHSLSSLTSIPGIGKGLSKKINEFLSSGSIVSLAELEDVYPVEALSMTIVPGIGVKTAFKYYNKGICNFEQLVEAANNNEIKNENIKRGIKLALKSRGRLSLNEALPVVMPILEALRNCPYVTRAEFAGSVRRGRETIKDADVLVVSSNRAETVKVFQQFGNELINGDDKSRIMAPVDARTDVQVDLLFCPENEFGAALAYFTGSKEHNIALRVLAGQRGMKINEHGFWSLNGDRLGGSEESELYELLGLPFCPPELREGSTLLNSIPNLITREDITTDWHMHTVWSSDAKDTFLDMAKKAKLLGLKSIGVSDHTEKQYGWDPERINERRNEADAAAKEVGIKIFAGCETGINIDGTLDWSDEYLSQMDFVIASIHKAHSKDPLSRLIAAAKHPMVSFIGHPTGRMIGRRDIPDVKWSELFSVCSSEGVLIEINGARIDLPPKLIRLARKSGCKFVINSDAHSVDQFRWQDVAITTARRAGITKHDLSIPEIKNEF